MPTHFARQLATAQAKIAANGQLVNYIPTLSVIAPNDPNDKPWEVGVASATTAGLNNIINELAGGDPSNNESGDDANTLPNPVLVSMVFLDAKARGSSTQGMVAEMVDRTDIVGGNKLGLLAGGVIAPIIGDIIDRNTGDITGYPLYKVAKIKTLDVDGTVIIYTLELEI